MGPDYIGGMKQFRYNMKAMKELQTAVVQRFAPDSREYGAIRALEAGGVNEAVLTAFQCMLMETAWSDAARQLSVVRDTRYEGARKHLRVAMETITASHPEYNDLFEMKGCRYLKEQDRWFVPQDQFIPGLLDNHYDVSRLAHKMDKIDKRYLSIFEEGYKHYLLLGYKTRQYEAHNMSYTRLCYLAALLQKTPDYGCSYLEEMRDAGYKSNARYTYRDNVVKADMFVEWYCAEFGADKPSYDLAAFMALDHVPEDLTPSNISHKKSPRITGVTLVQLKLSLPEVEEREETPAEKMARLRLAREALAHNNHSQNGTGHAGSFNYAAARDFIEKSLRDQSADFSPLSAHIYLAGAEKGGLSAMKIAQEFNTSSLKVKMHYAAVSRFLRDNAHIESPTLA